MKIAPLIFVAFIENAFKYFSRDLPVSELSIALVENENQIIFECSNSYIELHKDQKGIGLINVSRRLELIYKNSYQLEISDQNGIIIIDDEPVARKIIREFVEKNPFLIICGQFEDANKAGVFLRQHQVDLLFVDIEMPGISGLEFVKSLPDKPMVILTTAFPGYAMEGYELDIVDYLLKPIAYNRFVKAVQKAKEYKDLKDTALPANNCY